MKFTMPADLAALSQEELRALLAAAEREFDELTAATSQDDATVSAETLEDMKALNAAADALSARISELRAQDEARAEEARALIQARTERAQTAPTTPDPADTDTDEDADADSGTDDSAGADEVDAAAVVAEAEQVVADAAAPVTAASAPPPSFRGLGARRGRGPAAAPPAPEIGFRMRPQVPKFVDGPVGFRELALSIDAMAVGTRVHANRAPHRERGSMVPLSLATLDRGFGASHQIDVGSEEELRHRIDELVRSTEWRGARFDRDGALVASGGHCAVPETIYTFCDVTPASGLLTLPAANFGPRGGQRRPKEPDFSELYNTLPWRFTEEELVATNPDGTAVVTKPCIEIPCVEWEEIQVEAIGLCVTAGILQKRGFPEAVERFLQEVLKAHLIKVSVWSILDMVAMSTPYTIPAAGAVGAAGAFLNGLSLRATLIRQQERIANDAVIEGVAPAWALEVAKADMALQQGVDVKGITDQQIDSWLSTKNIRMQWVQHWQQLPTASVRWPTSVQALLYPAGAFVQHLENVIEVGTLYDKAMLQKNRYMELFTEDEYAVDKRCRVSEMVTVPLCANGSVGAREQITCTATTNEVQTATISGSPTGGTFTMSYDGETTPALPHNASLAAVQSALAGLPTIGAGNVAVTGTPGTSYVVTFQGLLGGTNVTLITATGSFTGGTDPDITVAQTTAGAPN
ncbi:major capsid protein [Nocardia sp. CDC159]|uniref:Major capsid protein n=1 Tax=Nocardia pulmonis TaxID=2951408 RepID=A0A9X2J0K7_9NOCA|nr:MULTISPECIES: major capsid protein [Nocardia]MCM6777924.1 major capsid protein [Nocardia pulmonis]MCM6790905.1 major capsid protein [Nocardia sp. CDC159]